MNDGASQLESTELWSSLLKSAGAVSATPSAALLLLGPREPSQTQFITRIQNESQDPNAPRIANKVGLGYTYVDFKDDNDDDLSHLDIYTLETGSLQDISSDESEESQSTITEQEFNGGDESTEYESQHESGISGNQSKRCKHTSAVIYVKQVLSRVDSLKQRLLIGVLFDWSDDFRLWAGQLRDWIDVIKEAAADFDTQSTINDLQMRLQTYSPPQGPAISNTNVTLFSSPFTNKPASSEPGPTSAESTAGDMAEKSIAPFSNIKLPLEKGQYDMPLGFDLLIGTIRSEKLSSGTTLSTSSTSFPRFSEDTVDYIQQFLRTVALKHGGSVVYTPYSLDIPFDGLTDILSERLQIPIFSKAQKLVAPTLCRRAVPNIVDVDRLVVPAGWDSRGKILALRDGFEIDEISDNWMKLNADSSVHHYEEMVVSDSNSTSTRKEEPVTLIDFQELLRSRYIMQKKDPGNTAAAASPQTPLRGRVNDNNPPKQSGTIGGIQLESVEEMVRRLKVRQAAAPDSPSTPDRSGERSESTTPNSSNQNKVLANFFQHLLTKHNSPGGPDDI
ncbi:hypothetical protein AWJ20_1564 [Sugiyamaella lignohabitans]|uniref:Dynein light intermediate chain n=1 Tax=Sugiyamaella lignohabitans TaxID=796027 RepID=A0A167DTP4_9ASCO|nr:uncharacterized protein AWJ20_1564 [Sugiyamaella lignohabitans]ANB13280.1 hypothetical protein AWJ20_1564 [Sugiyamaella lignohabitans]